MSEHNAPDHWAKLLTDMGVQPPPEVSQPTSEPVKEEESAEAVGDETVASEPLSTAEEPVSSSPLPKPVERVRPVSDWDRLAEVLGVPVSRRSSKPAVTAAEKAEVAAPMEVEAPREVEDFDKPNEPAEIEMEVQPSAAAKEWEDEMVELTDPLFLDNGASSQEDSADGESEPAGETSDESSEPKPKSGRRRRRRRRGRRLPETESTESEVQEAEMEAASDTVDLIDAEPVSASSASENEATPAGEGDESTERRKRRRRRRPRRKSEANRGEATPAGESVDGAPPAEHAEADTGEEEWSGAEEDSDEASGSDEEGQSFKLSHRAIPTWEEAIQLVIANNVESRAKHPNSAPSSRGRSSRKPRERPSGK